MQITKKLLDSKEINPTVTKIQVMQLRGANSTQAQQNPKKPTKHKRVKNEWPVPSAVDMAMGLLSDGSIQPHWAPEGTDAGSWLSKRKSTGDVTDAVLLMPGSTAWENTFTYLGTEFAAVCFLTGATKPLIAMYFGERSEEFSAAFNELGKVLVPMV